jgi:hypothetical protein
MSWDVGWSYFQMDSALSEKAKVLKGKAETLLKSLQPEVSLNLFLLTVAACIHGKDRVPVPCGKFRLLR